MTSAYPPGLPPGSEPQYLPAIQPPGQVAYPLGYGRPAYPLIEMALSAAIAQCVAAGWRVEVVTGSSAVLVTGSKPNHLLHAIISFFTCFAWLIVWIPVALSTSERRMTLTVSPDGQVHYSKARRSG